MKKQPLVSVLVHTKNSERTVLEHLQSIKNQSCKHIEIVAVNNNSRDMTVSILKEFTKHVYSHGPERSAQRNFAAKKANGDYFLVPDSDMILGRNVVGEYIALVLKNPKIKPAVIPEKSVGSGFCSACKAQERSFYLNVDWMEAARFFEKKTFFVMGGYDEKNTGTEDYDLPQRIKEKYGDKSIGRTANFIAHDEGNLSFCHSLKKKFYYGKKLHVYKRANPDYYKNNQIFSFVSLFFSQSQQNFLKILLREQECFFSNRANFAPGVRKHIQEKYKENINVYDR